ncbi:MAG: leucine-rich repeat domain-containing protein [Kiritimatiellae bacterium]|nr:leucine-rich repeat domain-containing protein [Kiritimatiellia bacterium]
MRLRTIALASLAAVTTPLVAMPTRQELKRAEGPVLEIMRPEREALGAGKKTRADVAKAAVAYAEKVDSDAVRTLLLKGAFTLYVRQGAFDEAADALRTLNSAVPDIPPAVVSNIVESALRNMPVDKDARLAELVECVNGGKQTVMAYVGSNGAPAIIRYDIQGELTDSSIPVNVKSAATSLNVGNAVTDIGWNAFSHCAKLRSVTIPDSVGRIGGKSFAVCRELASIAIPGNVTKIENWAFMHCSALTNVTLATGLKHIGATAFKDVRVSNWIIPDSVETIGFNAFSYNKRLASITFGKGLKSLGAEALAGCGKLASVVFKGRTLEEVRAMDGYPWGLSDTSIIRAQSDASGDRR